jgi:co-chaperonin GroES (HSP10)
MKLLSNYLLVERIIVEQTPGGIVMPQSMRDGLNTGGVQLFRVMAAGPGKVTRKGVLIPSVCIPGDRVFMKSYHDGAQMLEDGQMIVSEDLVLAVLPINPQPEDVCEAKTDTAAGLPAE